MTRRVLRHPLLHFAALGLLLALVRGRGAGPADPSRVIDVGPEVVARVASSLGVAADALPPGALDDWIDDEVLHREGLRRGLGWNPSAIARRIQVGQFVGDHEDEAAALGSTARLGLERDDPVLRGLVVGRMRLQLAAEAVPEAPDDATLAAWLAAHPARFAQPARTTFVQVFVPRARGAAAADTLAGRLRADDTPPAAAQRLGDPFPAGERFVAQAPADVATLMGPAVADAVASAPRDAWTGPVASPYGWHVVRVTARTPARVPALDAVRTQVAAAWRREQATRRVAERVRALRAAYRIALPPAVATRDGRRHG